ncbi:MAG: peptide chain release factor N(5)-glutamine methyltransferase [Bacteroidales bacterium]|nr:peptide chain release factor N(5)-glutamine methyltransferase [Bacteroidales bacterium]
MPNTTHMTIPSNRVRDIERHFHTTLSKLYPDTEIEAFIYILFEAFLGWDKVQLLLHREGTINQSDLLRFYWAAEDLKQYRPIQYIVGYTTFCNLRIKVSEGVLIPRPETEEIVEHIKQCPSCQPESILDLCTGSGCIALALASHYRDAYVYGIDISAEALTLARRNALTNNLNVSFYQCDILHHAPTLPHDTFDLIVSNPPYVCESEKSDMLPNVLNHEPALALFVPDNDPLLFYRAIGQYAQCHLSSDGLLVLEINEHYGNATCQMLQQMGFDTTLNKDFRDKERSITAHKTLKS